ncbi:UDP-N-acetylglucosamine:LPS N-acetylglucosamine transferase [Bradyrhizobium sp. GM2.4]
MDTSPLILLAAGGTGGHLFPAEALGVELIRRGFRVRLVTDERALRYSGLFTKDMIDVVSSETARGRNPLQLAYAGLTLAAGTLSAYSLIKRLKPVAVVGFGGYPTLPPLVAAKFAGVPGIIHDANAVLGRANRFLSSRVQAIATSLPGVLDRDPALSGKTTTVGTPMRPAILAAAGVPYAAPEVNGPLRLLVVGGSQGARIMADIVPGAIERLEPALWSRLVLTQQVRDEDMARVRAVYDRLKIKAELAPFFHRSSGTAGLQPSGGVALRRRHRGGTCRDRAALDPGAAAGRDRPGPVRQCRRAGQGRRCDPHSADRVFLRSPRRRDLRLRRRARASCRHGAGRPRRRPARRSGAAGRSGGQNRGNLTRNRPEFLLLPSWPGLSRPSTSCKKW